MAIIATGQKTIIDLSDGKSLSVYLGSNQPRTQIQDSNNGTYVPDWSSTAGKLVITPVVYANQTAISLTDSALSVTYKRKEGSSSEAVLVTGESVSNTVVTFSANKLSAISSGLLTYLIYVTYTDPDNGMPINATADITFALVTTGENAKSAWISGEQVFKYAAGSTTANPAQITLTANLQNVTMGKWQYKNSSGSWTDYPTTSDNSTITGTTLIVKPAHSIWVGDAASIRITTSNDNVGDATSIYKVADGATGENGAPGKNASVVFLTNENVTFAGNELGQVSATTATCNVVAYTGTTKVTPTVGQTISGAPSGMTVTKGNASSNEIPITMTIAANANLGSSGKCQGSLSIPITSPVSTTLKINWSKVNTGATGAAGADAVVFSIYAPNGTVFTNGEGNLTIQTAAYKGSTAITSGATYKWEKYQGGSWTTVTGTSGSLSVAGSTVTGTATYRCTMTYNSKSYSDVITLTDKTDNYQATIESTGGEIFKNSVGSSVLTCRLFQNGVEVDVDGTAYSYTWYKLDKDGESQGQFGTGKSVNVDQDDVEVKSTFTCEVSQKE